MKRIASIVISFTVLILLLFGTGGLSLMKCSCTGKVTLLLPTEGNCCPQERSCMTVKVWKVSDATPTLQKTVCDSEVIMAHPVAVLPSFVFQDIFSHLTQRPMPLIDSRPPGRTCTSVEVLRV